MDQQRKHWTPGWTTAVGGLSAVLVTVVERSHLQPVGVSMLPVLGLLGGGITGIIGLVQEIGVRTHLFRTAVWAAGSGWVTWATAVGWHQSTLIALGAGTAALTAAAPLFRSTKPISAWQAQRDAPTASNGLPSVERPVLVVRWEAHIRHLSGKPVRVTRVEPWDNPRDGQRVYIDLPAGLSWRTLATPEFLENLQAACRLPQGCVIRGLEGDHQGAAMLDVMLRDCLTDEVLIEEDVTPTSINDPFVVMTTPRGEPLDIALRSQSMVIGGAPDAGKTTLLHRIIMRLARCVDALIWVIDLNGGGVAEPWIRPWALGLCDHPVVDWIADSEESAAVMTAVAAAIAKDRKTSQVAAKRRRAANSTVLPVDRSLPAIIVITDEYGEVHQAASLLGQLAGEGISRLAQIGRAEAVRVIVSVLRGTSDILAKGMRVNAAIRLCLRMLEEDEYGHVLGMNPAKVRLRHKGSGYLVRAEDQRPIFGRTVNVLLDAMERHAIACSVHRPWLDERGGQVAARVRVADVLEGREPAEEIMALPIMQDVEAGRAYDGRWDRYAYKLAEMRGEDPPEEPAAPRHAAPVVPQQRVSAVPAGGALAALTAAAGIAPPVAPVAPAAESEPTPTRTAVDLDDEHAVDEAAHQLLDDLELAAKLTARDYILAVLRDTYPEPLWPKQIAEELARRGKEVTRTYVQDLLKALKTEGVVSQEREGQPYSLVVTP
jgi:S-DNA-T family DNA segregation ATPase FtsK/SpoIIIE